MADEPSKENSSKATQENHISKLPKIISFSDIARCGDEVWIENNGELYRLQKTKNGKLIMTK